METRGALAACRLTLRCPEWLPYPWRATSKGECPRRGEGALCACWRTTAAPGWCVRAHGACENGGGWPRRRMRLTPAGARSARPPEDHSCHALARCACQPSTRCRSLNSFHALYCQPCHVNAVSSLRRGKQVGRCMVEPQIPAAPPATAPPSGRSSACCSSISSCCSLCRACRRSTYCCCDRQRAASACTSAARGSRIAR